MQQAAVREPLPPPEQIEQLTREVLARPEFQPAVGDRAGEIFWDLVRGVFGGLLDWSAANPGQARLLSWLITLALGLLLAYLLAGLISAFMPAASVRWMNRGAVWTQSLRGMAIGLRHCAGPTCCAGRVTGSGSIPIIRENPRTC